MKNDINLQDAFLNVVRQQAQVITVILMNGYQTVSYTHLTLPTILRV